MNKARLMLAVGMIACLPMAFAAVRASDAGTGDVVIATNEVVNYHLQKNQPSVTFILTNQVDEPYLWIMAHACDMRKIEHGSAMLKIEVNGVAVGPDRSALQGETFRTPGHPKTWRWVLKKYDGKKEGWIFKWDVDFVMNNQCGSVTNFGRYATADLNHWYVFGVNGIATNGVNRVTLTECVTGEMKKYVGGSKNYDGFIVGTLGFGNMEDMKQRVAAYEKQQMKIDPGELTWEKIAGKRYNLEVPKGRTQCFNVKDGFIRRNGKPFFMAYDNFGVGHDSLLKIYSYYGLINVRMSGMGSIPASSIMELPIYLKDGWEKYRPRPWEMAELLDESRMNYDQGLLTVLYVLSTEGGNDYLENNFPNLFAQYADGTVAESYSGMRYEKFNNFTHPMLQEYLRQTHTVLGREFRNHPGVCGASLWEEMGWRLRLGSKLIPQGPEDIKRYREWLERKYGDIRTLNLEWDTDYRTFFDIRFPARREQTANFANFQLWRSEATVKCAQIQYEAFKSMAPDQFVMGQKTYGDILSSQFYLEHAVDNWALTEWVDVSREYSSCTAMAHLGRSSCRAFGGKAMEANICFAACEFKQKDKANEWHQLLDQKGKAAYPYIMQMVFNGNKAFHWELGSSLHFIHYNKRWGKGVAGDYTGQLCRLDNAGITADVVVEERTMKIARAQQLIMRNASLVLPASVPKSDVAVLMTTASRMIGHDPQDKLAGTKKIIQSWMNNAGQDFYMLGDLFDNMHLTFDCVEERIIDEIFKYKVLIVGYQANVMSRKTAEKIKEYVKKGGTVLFYPEAGTWNSVNFQKDKASNETSPGFGLSELCGAKIDNEKIIEHSGILVKNEASGYKAGEMVMTNRYYGVKLESAGGEVVATTEDGLPVLVKGANGKFWYFGGYLGLTYYQSFDEHERFVQLIEGILKSAGVEKRVEIEGMADRRKVIPGLLEGEGYWLVGVNNFDDQGQKLKIRVNGIPSGEYEVVDISGEKFTFEKGKDGNNHMKPDPEGALVKYVTGKTSGKELAGSGFDANVPGYMSKVWLIRPAGVEVWVNATKEALRSYVELKKPLKIVAGYGCDGEEQKLAEELSQVLAKKGLTVTVVKDSEIKTKVVEGKLVEDGYELEKYRHVVIDDDANLILIGNAAENNAVKHLETAGNYVFNKVPEIVDEKYPGKGRGIIQLVESINHVSYDATDKGRDAILAGGSDREGTIKAIKELMRILK